MKTNFLQYYNYHNNIQLKKNDIVYNNKKINYQDSKLINKNSSIVPYYISNINFKAANSKHLKKLFSYGLPCMYTGIEMIDYSKIEKLFKKNIHNLPAQKLITYLEIFEKSLMERELEVYNLIKQRANLEPNKDIHQIMQLLNTEYGKELIKEQLSIFKTLTAYSYSLPANLQKNFNDFIQETECKVLQTPILTNFGLNEFKYKLGKIKYDIDKMKDNKALSTITSILNLAKQLSNNVEKDKTLQIKIINNMQRELKNSNLNNYKPLKELLDISEAKIKKEKVLVPFSRKAFIYDLGQLLENIKDSRLKSIFMKIAMKLPSSQNNTAAYISKVAKEPNEKIVFRLLTPSTATIEHLLPKSEGGADLMSNYGGAASKINSERQSIPFEEQIKIYPLTAKYCQKYIDRLIEYAKQGIFEKEKIDIRYIEDFKTTIQKESKNKIILNTSKLYENGRFCKPEPTI